MTGIRDRSAAKLFSADIAGASFHASASALRLRRRAAVDARRLGLRVAEIPVTWVDDPRSTSSISMRRALVDLVRIRQGPQRALRTGRRAASGSAVSRGR
jgi:hypothetical protein